jgi:hypothetical protein
LREIGKLAVDRNFFIILLALLTVSRLSLWRDFIDLILSVAVIEKKSLLPQWSFSPISFLDVLVWPSSQGSSGKGWAWRAGMFCSSASGYAISWENQVPPHCPFSHLQLRRLINLGMWSEKFFSLDLFYEHRAEEGLNLP